MKITYDKKIDAMYIYLTSKKKVVTDTKEIEPGVIVDYVDKDPVGIEILDASKVLGSKLGLKKPTPIVSYAHKIKP